MSRVSDGSELHTLLHEFRSIPTSAQYCSLVTFAIPSVCILHYCTRVVQDHTNCPGGILLQHCFYEASQTKISLRVLKDVYAKCNLYSAFNCFVSPSWHLFSPLTGLCSNRCTMSSFQYHWRAKLLIAFSFCKLPNDSD